MKRALLSLALCLICTTCSGPSEQAAPTSPPRLGLPVPAAATPRSTVFIQLVGTEERPILRLFAADGVREGALGTSCWTTQGRAGWGTGCLDAAGAPADPPLVELPSGTVLRIGGDADGFGGALGTLEPGGPYSAFHSLRRLLFPNMADVVDLPPGDYGLNVWADWDRGDGDFYFAIRVTDPVGRRLASAELSPLAVLLSPGVRVE